MLNSEIVKELNKLIYPMSLIDEFRQFVWGNKKFYSVHADLLKTNGPAFVNYKLKEKILSSINKEYMIENNAKYVTYKIIKSNIEIESKKYDLLSFFDISKQKEIINNFSKKRLLFETLSENLPEGIIVHKQELIEYTNPTFEKLCGFNGIELKKKNFIDIFTLNEQSPIIDLLQKLVSKEIKKFSIDIKILTKKNKEIWIRLKTKTITQENNLYFLSIVIDITKEKSDNEKLETLAYFDNLTGIFNRRKFDEVLKIETNRVHRYQRKLSAFFFDIDHFKKVNDTYGHNIGDQVLRKMSEIVHLHIRETDYFARWGGEEFIVLLPETNVMQANSMAENIRKTVAIYSFEKVGNLTISIGVSELKEKERSSTFLKRIDTALYKAKSDGRNRTIVF